MFKKIVNTLILTAILAAPATLKAQSTTRWGVTVGGNYNKIHFQQADIFASDKMFGGMAGLTGEMMISGIGFGVDASLLYNLKQGRLHMGDRKIWSSQGLGNEVCRLHYIDVPLNLKFKYRNLNGLENTIAPIAFFGPTFSFLAGHNNIGDNQLKYNTVSVGLHGGLGVELFNKFQLNASYNFNLGETCRTTLLDEHSAKSRTWQVTATYFF